MHRVAMRRRLLDDHGVVGHHLAKGVEHERARHRIASALGMGRGPRPGRLAVRRDDAAEQVGDATAERRDDRGADRRERRGVGVVGEQEQRRAVSDRRRPRSARGR